MNTKTMIDEHFDFKKSRRFLPQIILVGLGIGTANYLMYGSLNWVQWSIQSLSTSLIIGYTLVTIGLNRSWFNLKVKAQWKLFVIISIAFLFTALIATELEQIIRSLVFQNEQYLPLSAGNLYLYNGIISLVLGISFFQYDFSASEIPNPISSTVSSESQERQSSELLLSSENIINIPVKQGENILFIPLENVVYFEAFDNYSFLHDTKGAKKLCDYSLRFLEQRLGENFSRIHRKYIVNKGHIKQIKPHLNGRYEILFDHQLSPITSSKGYSSAIRKMIRIE